MKLYEKYDTVITGLISGLVFPVITGFVIYFLSPGHNSIKAYLARITDANILTHSITLCAFSNIIIFLLFNRFDMLRANKGVLAMTILWAIIVFGIKFLG